MSEAVEGNSTTPFAANVGDSLENNQGGLDEENKEGPTDIALIPQELAAYPHDVTLQSEVLDEIIGTASLEVDKFREMPVFDLKLSKLKRAYERQDGNIVSILSKRHMIQIDDEFSLRFDKDEVYMDASKSMIDYQLTVANCIGLSALLPNAETFHTFGLDLDLSLNRSSKQFKCKHAMLGFDPAGCMLYIGKSGHQDIYLAMAPKAFLAGHFVPPAAGHKSGSPRMSPRHHRQVLMMMAHFLAQLSDHAFYNLKPVYELDLDEPDYKEITETLTVGVIRLNFEDIVELDKLIVDGYNQWVDEAPGHWKADGFLSHRVPIVVTSRFGQNSRIASVGYEEQEAHNWELDRDYSKIAFLTVAIATSIECTQIHDWEPLGNDDLRERNPGVLYDGKDPRTRRPVDLDDLPLLSDERHEVPIYDVRGNRILRRQPMVDPDESSCGVLVDLANIQALFNRIPDVSEDIMDELSTDGYDDDSHLVNIDVYPLAFLRTAGNVQASGIPHCFYNALKRVNESVRTPHESQGRPHARRRNRASPEVGDEDEDEDDPRTGEDQAEQEEGEDAPMNVDEEDRDVEEEWLPRLQVVKPIACQLYNYMTHRVAERAGMHDSQHGTVTAAISGAFANNQKDRNTASRKQRYCKLMLPYERFHQKIDVPNCPRCCRVEMVFTIDIRGLKNPSGKSIFKDIILPLVRSWKDKEVLSTIKDYLVVLKPEVFPKLFDWVAHPVTLMIKGLFDLEMEAIQKKRLPCPFRVELIAALERVLCFCHTGSTAVFATSLMNRLGLSRGAVVDGFPMLLKLFKQPTISSAMKDGFDIDARQWPVVKMYPAIASMRTQELTYSMSHFLAYQASFRIEHAKLINTKKVYANLDRRAASTPGVVKALHILEIAFDAFFDDTRQLVAEGVRADVAHRISAASSQEELKAAKSSGAIREGYLKSWLKSTRPLAYESEDQVGAFQQLVRAVAPDERSAYYGLPHLTKNATVPSQLVETLIEMSCPVEPKRPGAPIVTNGAFLPTLKIAHQSILSLREESEKQDQIRFLTHMLHLAIKVFRVHFFPAALPGSGAAGRPSVKPVYNSWGNMAIRERAEQAALDMDVAPVEAMIAPEAVALNNVLAMDCNAEWYANDLDLTTIGDFLKKTRLPTDFKPPLPAKVPYVDDTYDWVVANYDGTKPLHHLALLVSIIVASTMLPKLFMPTGLKNQFQNKSRGEEVWKVYSEIEWVKKDKKGMKDKCYFISMFTTFVIAIYESKSPLRQHMKSTAEEKGHILVQGLGSAWTTKHSAKGVTYTNLIRLRLLWGDGTGAYDKGRFQASWGCHGDEYIGRLYERLRKILGKNAKENPYVPFDALSLLIGDKNARAFCKNKLGLSYRPPHVPASTPETDDMEDPMLVD